MRFAVRLTILFALLFTAFSGSHAMGQFFFFENPLLGEPAPDFTLNTVDDTGVNFTEYRDGQAALIFFWATWCPHCQVQLGALQEQQAALAADGIKVVIVDLGENAGRVRSYLRARGMSFQVFLDEESTVADEYGVMGIPTFCLVDREGIVRSVGHEIPEDYQTLLAAAPKS